MNDMPDQPEDVNSEEALEASTRRWMWAALVLMILFALAFPLFRFYEPTQRAEARESQTAFLAAQGAELFEAECSSCHGVGGAGGIAPAVGSRNFLESVDDVQVSQLVSVGVPGTEMVAYSIDFGGPMTSEEIHSVTTYLRSLEEEAEPNPFWQTPLANENLSGEDLYTMACARCHGIDRMGIEDSGPDLSQTSFALEESDEWLIARIHDGKNEMPRFGRILTEDQIETIVVFLRGGTALVTTTTTAPPAAGETTTTTTAPDEDNDAVLILGEEIFLITAGGTGCAKCHGIDGQGTGDGPSIIGVSKSAISTASGGGVPDMDDIKLTRDELEAVYQYLRTLSP